MFKSIRTEIAKNQWQSFCDGYTRQHLGWLVKVDIYDPSMSKLCRDSPAPSLKAMAIDMAFRGIVFQSDGFRPELLINLGSGKELFTHRLIHPTHIVSVKSAAGLHEGLLIHDRKGGIVQIRFREPANPELLDGWFTSETGVRNRSPWLPTGAL
ncbi:MAG: DUF5335 family protein [Gammaproteobacteria bacterium]